MKWKLLLLCLGFLSCLDSLHAQDSSIVQFYVRGSDVYYIRINDQVLPLSNKQMLPAGTHNLEIWSPRYKLHSSTITVPANDSIAYVAELNFDSDYRGYMTELDNYKRKQFWLGTAPVVLFCVSSIATGMLYTPLKRANEDRVKESFGNQFSGGASSSENQKTHARLQTAMFTSVGAGISSIAWYLIASKTRLNMEKPKYKQQNPFTLDYFELSYHPIHQVPQAGLTLRF